MNIKTAINSQLSVIESKNQTKQTAEQKKIHRYGDHLYGYHLGVGRGEWEKGTGIKKYKLVGTE